MHCALPPSPSTTITASDHQPLPGDLYVRADNVKISSPFEHLPKNHCQRKIEPYHLASCNLKHDAFTSVPPQLPLPLTPGRHKSSANATSTAPENVEDEAENAMSIIFHALMYNIQRVWPSKDFQLSEQNSSEN